MHSVRSTSGRKSRNGTAPDSTSPLFGRQIEIKQILQLTDVPIETSEYFPDD